MVRPAPPARPCPRDSLTRNNSGIFGYVNYLVEKDRKFILNTLVNGKFPRNSTARLPRC